MGLVVLQGCSFQSNQINFMKSVLAETGVILPRWALTLEGDSEQKTVFPVALSGGDTLFTDGEYIRLYFDGWNFVRLEGISETGSFNVYHEIKEALPRWSERQSVKGAYLRAPDSEGSFRVDCLAWEKLEKGGKQFFKQVCSSSSINRFANKIRVDSEGQIEQIETAIMNGGRLLEVSRVL
ncbi:MAG TPA: hypothetical protein DCS80_01580 [Betaproteobacteria bacterium]|nr:hypothetical protein [Betaproteobacteria bacterium]